MKELEVVVFGSTGLVGKALIKALIADKAFVRINVVTRRPLDYRSKKISQVVTDFENLDELDAVLKSSEICFYCIGTTIKKAKTKDRFREIEPSWTRSVPASYP